MVKYIKFLGFMLFSSACFYFAYHAFYYLFQPISNPFQQKMHDGGWVISAHLFASGLTLMLVPFQWSGMIRRKRKAIHKITGMIYAIGVLIGGCSGFIMALNATGGIWPKVSFGISGLLWIVCTFVGIYCATKGNIISHRKWMTRSIALCASAITLRTVLGLGIGVFHMPFLEIYVIASWTGWGLNMFICELMLFWQKRSQQTGVGNHLVSNRQIV